MGANYKPALTIGQSVIAIFVGVWVLGWSAGTLLFDVLWARSIQRQITATYDPTASGSITHSSVESESDSDGTTYKADVRYVYYVGDRRFEGVKIRGGVASATLERCRASVARYPVESTATVYYRRGNPTDAILEAGLSGQDLVMGVFLTPFNLIMIGSWVWAVGGLYRTCIGFGGPGARLFASGEVRRVRIPSNSPAVVAATVLLIVSVGMIAVVGVATGFVPSILVATIVIAITIAAPAASYMATALPIWKGQRDLVVDPVARTLTLPATGGRKERLVIPFGEITRIDVQAVSIADSDGGTRTAHAPTAYVRGLEVGEKAETIVKWADQGRAAALAAWVSEQVVPARSIHGVLSHRDPQARVDGSTSRSA